MLGIVIIILLKFISFLFFSFVMDTEWENLSYDSKILENKAVVVIVLLFLFSSNYLSL